MQDNTIQAVILAAGRGTRMAPLNSGLPKPMLPVNGKTLIEHKIHQLPDEVNEVVLVVGHLSDKIRDYFGDQYNGRKITYVVQEVLNGTGGALWCARDVLHNRFIVMMGDDLYAKEDVVKCLEYPWSLLVSKSYAAFNGGDIALDSQSNFKDINEGQHEIGEHYINAALYVLNKEIFSYPLVAMPNGEYSLPHTLLQVAKDIPVKAIEATFWVQVSNPADLPKAEARLKLHYAETVSSSSL